MEAVMDRREPLENESNEATLNGNGKANVQDAKENEETAFLPESDENSKYQRARYLTEWQSPISEWLKPIHEWQRPLVEYQEPIREWYVEFGSRPDNGEEGADEEIFQP